MRESFEIGPLTTEIMIDAGADADMLRVMRADFLDHHERMSANLRGLGRRFRRAAIMIPMMILFTWGCTWMAAFNSIRVYRLYGAGMLFTLHILCGALQAWMLVRNWRDRHYPWRARAARMTQEAFIMDIAAGMFLNAVDRMIAEREEAQ